MVKREGPRKRAFFIGEHMKYIVAIRSETEEENPIFEFKTKETRKLFIDELLECKPDLEYMTVESE
ncbi:MAG: hypothetical protein DRI46_10945 [Chloroflexi bacterium]|nr:MAG: hypothetical protein DRI46_10945 [Chloroflexota bacterium]